MPYCAWERKDFGAEEFIDYRGAVLLHTTSLPYHLTTGELPDSKVDLPESVQAAMVELGRVDLPTDDAGDAGGVGNVLE